jgi:hypothetical protein
MGRQMLSYDKTMKESYTSSESHTIQIDCPEYSYYLQKAWERGRKRAAAAGNSLPVRASPVSLEDAA